MASKTQICNMALGHIGITQTIADVDTERSSEAYVCRTYYDNAVQFVLEDFPWPFATQYATLGLVEEEPNNDWGYAYRYPNDALYVRRIVTYTGRYDVDPPAFRLGQDEQGRLIYTDEVDAIIEYTTRVTDPNRFTAKFVELLSWKLAADIAPGLTRNPDFQRNALTIYSAILGSAKVIAANEQQQTEAPDSEFIRART